MVASVKSVEVEMETHHLRYFITVAEELHFGRAALKLHIAQPPLSRHIKALERYLGVELFYRDRRHVRLTAAGETFLPTAREILRLIGIAAEETSRALPVPSGSLTLAIPTQSSHALVREIIEAFGTEVPGVALQKTTIAPDEIVPALCRGFVDIALLYMSGGGTTELIEETFIEDSAVAVLWKGHRLSRRKSIRLRELAEEHWILYHGGHQNQNAWNFLRKKSLMAGFRLESAAVTPTLVEAMAAVDRREGITIIPRSYDYIAHLQRRYVLVDESDLCVPLSIYSRKGDKQSVTNTLMHLARQCTRRRAAISPSS